MSTVTATLVQFESKARKDGRAPIYLRITARRKSKYKSTGIAVEPKHWNADKQQVRKSHELSNAYNDKLSRLRLNAEEVALDVKTAEAAMSKLTTRGGTLTAYFEDYIEKLARRKQYWERKKYSTTLRKLQEMIGRMEVDWADLNRNALYRFEAYCADERGNNPNTIRKELERLRRVVQEAVRDELVKPGDNPFLFHDLPKAVPPNRRRLTLSEIRSLQNLDISDKHVRTARDAFIWAFYAGGMRFGDICRLRREMVKNSRLRYRMMKTDQLINLRLPPVAVSIINRQVSDGPYVFPFLDPGDEDDPVRLRERIGVHNVLMNRALKAACKMAGIDEPEEVTFHVARHSFADYARRKSEDVYAVSKALGHSSLKTTEHYFAGFDTDATDKLIDTLWED